MAVVVRRVDGEPQLGPTPRREPSPREKAMAAELGEWLREWAATWADKASKRFTPRDEESDYPLHHVLVDAPPEAVDEYFARARQIRERWLGPAW